MDRASDSGSEGWGFESLPVYQTVQIRTFYQLVKGSDLLFSFEAIPCACCETAQGIMLVKLLIQVAGANSDASSK